MKAIVDYCANSVAGLGEALIFFRDVVRHILKGHIRVKEVVKQVYEQGIQSVVIIGLTSVASGLVLAMQGYVAMSRFGAKEYISHLVALSLVRELSPVFTALIFSGKAGARIAAELGAMNVNDQMLATRTLGVDPIEFLVVPRMIACFIALPILTIISEFVGIAGGYFIGVYEAHVPGPFYINQTIQAIRYVDFFSGFLKVFVFAILISWVCCYQGFMTRGGSLGVGKFTTKAVALSYIAIIIANTILTKLSLMFWG